MFPSLSSVSLARLIAFCQVVQAGSIAAAAPQDPARQSQFSRQIKELEEALGLKLFVREGKRLKLTPEGRSLAILTQNYFASIEEITGSGREEQRPIRLGGGEAFIRWVLFPRLTAVLDICGPAAFDVCSMPTLAIISGLQDGTLDMGVIRSDAVEDGLLAIPVGTFQFRLVLPRRMLPDKSAAGIHLLNELPVVLIAGDGKLVRTLREVVARAGLNLDVRLTVANFSLVLEAMENCALAGVLPAVAAATISPEKFAVIELPGMEKLSRELSLVVNGKAAAMRASIRRTAERIAKALAM